MHDRLLINLKNYSDVRDRGVSKKLKGVCNGVSLLLILTVYEKINQFYEDQKNGANLISLEELMQIGCDEFFSRLNGMIDFPNLATLKDSDIKSKHQLRHSIEWYRANEKLQTSINDNKINLTALKSSQTTHRYLEILQLAKDQNIITVEEEKILNNAYIADIPIFEVFLNEVMLMQFSHEYLFDIPQNAFADMFDFLYTNNNIPRPIIELEFDLVLTPLELAKRSPFLISENGLALVSLPDHMIAFIKIGETYQFFDINNRERLPFTRTPELILTLLAKHDIILQVIQLKKNYFNNLKEIANLNEKINQIDQLQNVLMAEQNRAKRLEIIEENLFLFPAHLGISVTLFKHPLQPLNQENQKNNAALKMTDEMINQADAQGETCLWKACAKGHYLIAKELLDRGADPNTKRFDGTSALYMASQNGYQIILELLNQYQVDLNIRNADGRTALYNAILSNNIMIVHWLLEQKADVNLGFEDPIEEIITTPLMIACRLGHFAIVELLIKYNAILDKNALFYACKGGHQEIVEFLIKMNINIESKGYKNSTPLIFAAGFGQLEVMKTLLQLGADINAKADEEMTALMVAVTENQLEAVKFLLDNNADSNCIDEMGNTVLHLACQMDNIVIVQVLLNEHTLNMQNNQGATPFMLACYCGHLEIVKFIYKMYPQSINTFNNAFGSALYLAIQNGKSEITNFLLNCPNIDLSHHLNKQTLLDIAIKYGEVNAVFSLLALGVCCSVPPNLIKTPLEVGGITYMTLSEEQKELNFCIKCFPYIFTEGVTLAEKIGLIFKAISDFPNYQSPLFVFKPITKHFESRIIFNILLDPKNKYLSQQEIQDVISSNLPKMPIKEIDLYFKKAFYAVDLILNKIKILLNNKENNNMQSTAVRKF